MLNKSDNPYKATNQTSPSDSPRPRPIVLSMFTIFFLTAELVSIAVTRGILTAMFEEFDLTLPAISAVAFHFVMVLATATTLAAAIATTVAVRHRRTAVMCQLALIGFGLALLITYVIGAALPLLRLITELS